jgi:RTX calcium-binding nonapeptide repeat (4 copies)
MRSTIRSSALALATLLVLTATPGEAALVRGGEASDLLFGHDDDNTADVEIQPDGVTANQSLNNADLIEGLGGHDVMIGLLGSDTMLGGPGDDVMIGGTEQGQQPNSDVEIGGTGNDIAIWAGGDGSDLFDGGPGHTDALVFGTIDKVDGIPVISAATGKYRDTGLPTANVTGQGGFCRLDRVADPIERGFDFLVRFFSRANGSLLVTVRTHDVEQLFCTSEAGGAITYADLTAAEPELVEVSLDDVARLNRTVSAIIR